MAYTERLSQLAALTGAEFDTAVGAATATLTLTDVDMSEHHRSRVIFVAMVKDFSSGTGAQAATAKGIIKSVKLQASSNTNFASPSTITASGHTNSQRFDWRDKGGNTGTSSASTTILSATTSSAGGGTVASATASTIATVSLEVSGEKIQAASTSEERYLRCLCKLAVDASSDRGILAGFYENDLGRYKPVDRTA